jgi:uncharacterized protein YceK
MIRRIALTLCVALLAGAASLSEATASSKSPVQVAAAKALRSGYIVASS